jgi:hypothetical protein
MGVGDILCEYIYGSFLLIKAALEVIIKTAHSLLEALDTLWNTLMSLCRFTIDVGIEAIINGIKVFQKWLVDQLINLDLDSLCQGLFKCPEFLEQVLDPNSLLCRTIRQYTNYDPSVQEELYKVVGDFRQFKDQICSFGFTYNFGLSAVKQALNDFYAQIDAFLKMLDRNKERIRRQLQSYVDFLANAGVFDMLDKLKNFFDCVLIDTEICSMIQTANSFYKTTLRKLYIEEKGEGYQIDSNISAYYMNQFDSRINNLNNKKQELQKLIDSIMSPSQVTAANNAFNLAANIFPGGASWDDIKSGNFWKKNKCYQYFKMERRKFIDAFRGKEGNEEFEAVSTDKILGGMTINDEKGTIELSLPSSNGIKTMVFEADPSMGIELVEIPGGEDYNVKVTDDKYQSNAALYDEKTDRIISSLRGAIEISVEGNEDLRSQVTRIGGMRGYTSETELMTGM